MSVRNKVIWSEGLFIKPQHFQQEYRHHEAILDARIKSLHGYIAGFTELTLNRENLNFGKISIERAAGTFPDGTTFDMPNEVDNPDVVGVTADDAGKTIYLAVPLKNASQVENSGKKQGGTRYLSVGTDLKDNSASDGDVTTIKVGRLHCKLLVGADDNSAYSTLPLCQILEVKDDSSIRLDTDFVPTHTDIQVSTALQGWAVDLQNLLRARAGVIARRIGDPSQGGVADVSDFLLLQVLNRINPWYKHVLNSRRVHPEKLYTMLLQIMGETSTFRQSDRLPNASIKAYRHEEPTECFKVLFDEIRKIMDEDRPVRAISLEIISGQFGLHTIPIRDATLFDSAEFILAVKSDLSLDDLNKSIQQKTKLSSIENIKHLITHALPGIPLVQLPVAPRQLPYHAGYTYFQVDERDPNFKQHLKSATGFALHISGKISSLNMEFWAIRD